MGRTVDYLETRDDLNPDKIGFYGLSLGATAGAVMTAVEKRFKASVLLSGGIPGRESPPEVNLVNFASRITVPTLMLNGKQDFLFRYEEQQVPMFRLLGVPDSLKRHALWEGGHAPPRLFMIRETLDWFDRYLGPVDR